MQLPRELTKMKFKQVLCEECVAFDQKTGLLCFLKKIERKPTQKACDDVKVRKERK